MPQQEQEEEARNDNEDEPFNMPHWTKQAFCVGQLLLLVFSITLVSTFQVVLLYKQNSLILQRKAQREETAAETHSKNLIDTLVPSEETQDLQLWTKSRMSMAPTEITTAAAAYWNQVVPYLKEWDAMLFKNSDNGDVLVPSKLPPASSHTYTALREAARLGHAEAQYYMANALASGILPFDYALNTTNVPLDMIPLENDEFAVESYLYWHMAALDGHIPSLVSLAHRFSEKCPTALPYYQHASHNIMDMLEQDMHSRAMVEPPTDEHVLSELFLKGAPSTLPKSNQPDEPADALRYYHMRASADDVLAAHTLARLHHYGFRGVSQNLTLALFYYEMAAALGHKESAGQAGKFHMWGMGLEWTLRNFVKAQSWFRVGAPHGLEECRQRFKNAQKQNQRPDGDSVKQCDAPSVNGLGLLHLWGMPLLLPRDVEKAKKYFELARDMGNADASYNLAMMRLGWKTHFATLDSLDSDDDSQSTDAALPNFIKDFRAHTQQPSKADFLLALQDFVTAANKGHLRAIHRLGIIYAQGVKSRDGHIIIAQDCKKALKQFRWIVNDANPYLSHHTRRAYKQYSHGNWQGALRNYLAAAEMGHENSQVNAAFLLQQGKCLSLNPQQCASASLRLWKAAVQTNPEAALRVGDMYYYGKLRDSPVLTQPGPFGWLPYVLYPERFAVPLVQSLVQGVVGEKSRVVHVKEKVDVENDDSTYTKDKEETCQVDQDGTCLATDADETEEDEDIVESDLEMAARYYRLAADVHKSPRANFNLGFLYEWGLGVKQDFPLAKRHYDLARDAPSREAEIAAKMALFALKQHERLVKYFAQYQDWFQSTGKDNSVEGQQIPTMTEGANVGHPVPPGPLLKGNARTKTDVIIKHLLSWETPVILILTILLWRTLQQRPTPRRNR